MTVTWRPARQLDLRAIGRGALIGQNALRAAGAEALEPGEAAVLWTALQIVGGYYVTHQLKGASNVYGTFATVIGLLVWIYLGAQITLLCAEVNVVRVRHLWPWSLVQPPTIEADRVVMRAAAEVEQRRPEETIAVAFSEERRDEDEEPPAPRRAGSSSG